MSNILYEIEILKNPQRLRIGKEIIPITDVPELLEKITMALIDCIDA